MKSVNGESHLASQLSGDPWYVEYIYTRPVIDRSPANFRFDKNGKVSGNASCNQFKGGYKSVGGQLTLSELSTTRRACVAALEEQERRFLAATAEVVGWKVENELLLLLDESGQTVFRAARQVQAQN